MRKYMIIQDFNDLQEEYKCFIEYIYCTQSYASDLLKLLNKFLSELCKSKYCNDKFLENIEINLVYLEHIFDEMENIIEYAEKMTLNKLKLKEIKNIVNLNDYIKIPDDYEKDVYVDIDKPIDWNK